MAWDEHPDLVLRARIVTSSWDGLTVAEVAQRLSCQERKVRACIHRFNARGLPAQHVRRGPGGLAASPKPTGDRPGPTPTSVHQTADCI
ncbi:helix-turn-helix domain-containing protein [Actinoplanes sp. NPDC049596]|uniref:helix-turn-helix domain-containing protein n=1 Tax=unclassified Actinoplanes TaxID=2626549 RepID=UPI0034122A39